MQTYGNTDAIGPFTAPSELQGDLNGDQGRGEKRDSTLLRMSKSAEEGGGIGGARSHLWPQLPKVAAAGR